MRKFYSTVLSLLLVVMLCACGNKVLTLEDIGPMNVSDDSATAYFEFIDGTLTVEVVTYVKSAASPTGKIVGNKDVLTYAYTLEGDNYVVVDGTKYYYEINEDSKRVNFSVDFMGLSDSFIFNYIR